MKKILLWIVVGIPALVVALTLFFYLGLPDVGDLKSKNPDTTALMIQRYREAQKSGQEFKLRQKWVDFDEIPKLLQDSIRVTEDAGFYRHQGVDFTELRIVLKKSWEKGKLIRGASTITQQLAKNLYLTTDKSIFRKIKEYFIARRLEKALPKNRIFHLYLNVIEFGPGIFGVQAASRYFFQKDVGQLGLEEIVRLTAVIPKPIKENPTGSSSWLKWKSRWILDTLKRYKYISPQQHQAAIKVFQ